ncbi:nucleotide sugar dehydrogenase [Bacillus paranthracis]|uniref:nucleotide sugar dehydrogenase n=1 Tax=Bacillus paranthracis TaxID=2026186 RepID=UPI0021D004CF|nr:nucleotide sugar dehydrogenase [Bacillus paranthracis]MCU5174420.1 nucleotide sugar dehydrogenase [Bacillus paranthracis]
MNIAIIGLGYVGISLAKAFSVKFEVVGFDINKEKIEEYKKGIDRTQEVGSEVNKLGIMFSTEISDISSSDIIIVTVPTPTINGMIDDSYVKKATEMIGKHMKKGAIVVYESTVYPLFTREECIPILERLSGWKCGIEFSVGYSPERVNPGDKVNTIQKITKVISGFDSQTLEVLKKVYGAVIENVYPVDSLEIAEACKILENSQRDLNIALINQFSMLFPDIGTNKVVEAMNTKWNALGFRSGLVGGHCIAEDPYYLIYKTRTRGNKFTLLEEARYINDTVPKHIVSKTMELLNKKHKALSDSNVVVKGITFKENCPDVRNSKVVEIVRLLEEQGANVYIVDPVADAKDLKNLYNLKTSEKEPSNTDVIIYAVAHDDFKDDELDKNTVVIDVKSIFNKQKHELYYAL